MKKMRLVSVLALSALLCAGVAHAAAKVTISLANGMAETHAVNVCFKEFIKQIEEKSNGEMTGVLYPNNMLGGDVVGMQGVQDGSIVMYWTTTANQVSLVPELAIFDIPFFFKDRDHAQSTLKNPKFVEKMDTAFRRAGFKLIGFDCTGFRWLSANKPIKRLEDIRGLKVRTMENLYHVAFWKALGVIPTPLANSERYAALQQGTVDGQENAVENTFNTKTYEVQKCFSNTQHIAYISSWVMNKDFYDGLSPEHKAIFGECMTACVEKAAQMTVERENDLLNEMETKFNRTIIRQLDDGEYERWGKLATPASEELVRKNLGDDVVDTYYKAAGKDLKK